MLKRFLHGLLFGLGFGLALVVVLTVHFLKVMPQLVEEVLPTSEPIIESGKESQIVPLDPEKRETREFSFFRTSKRMREIPLNGGILAMCVLTSEGPGNRPTTFQLWLTEEHLWKIRTEGEAVEVEEEKYPDKEPVESIDELMHESTGWQSGFSTMVIQSSEIEKLSKGLETSRDDHMNGSLRITEDGVVFFLPTEYET